MLLASLAMSAQNERGENDPILKNELDSVSYFLGLTLGYDFLTLPFEADPDMVIAGLSGAMKGTTGFSQQHTEAVFRGLQMAFQEREQEKANAEASLKEQEGINFLKENAAREGVVTTGSGLQYEVLVKGDGPMPADTSEVEVHYEGSLMDGTVFDSSYERGESISFPLNRVIPGWTEGVQLMSVGSTHMLYIPSELGYGSQGTGPIPPNSVLIFKIELLGIK